MDRLPRSQVFHGHSLSHKFFLATALNNILASCKTVFVSHLIYCTQLLGVFLIVILSLKAVSVCKQGN